MMADKHDIRGILIDLDGVIRHYPREREAAIERMHGLPTGSFFRIAFTPDLLEPAITGIRTDAAWRSLVREGLEKLVSPDVAALAETEWTDFCGALDHSMVSLLNRVRNGSGMQRSLALLTNATDRLKPDLAKLGIPDLFDMIFNSSEIGIAKPDARVFRHALKAMNLDVSQVVFVDDRLENIAWASQLGIRSYLFTDAPSLERDLQALSLL